MSRIQGVLFDLDGTLLDTAPDLLFSLNHLREAHQLPSLPLSRIRPIANMGSKAMLKVALEVEEGDARYEELRHRFLTFYREHLAESTRLFPNMVEVLQYLNQIGLPWGIVTNKLTRHTTPLLEAIPFPFPPGCVVCGDTLEKAKPDPAPILHACEALKITPANCLFVGDASTDILASKAAGTASLVAMYGYIHDDDDPQSWAADGYIHDPLEIIEWLKRT